MEEKNCEACWISLILRVAVASLFAATAAAKFIGGAGNVAAYFQSIFQNTWLPSFLVSFWGYAIPYVEAFIPIWLILGWKLKGAWIFTAFVFVVLAFGMVVAKQYGTAADNFFYVLLACLGLYFSPHDRLSLDGRRK